MSRPKEHRVRLQVHVIAETAEQLRSLAQQKKSTLGRVIDAQLTQADASAKPSVAVPYSSDQQRKWAHTTAGTKALGGKRKVAEWDKASKGKKLPARVGRRGS